VSKLDPKHLVFVDECGTNISLAPLYARAPKGERAYGKVPKNRGKNVTLLSSLSSEGVGASMAIEGATDKGVFEAYVEHFLAPTLKQGQVVIMDNLQAHKGHRVRRSIEARGAKVLFLPPYSPDFNPIEEAFSKIKNSVRKAKARSKEALLDAIGRALDGVSPSDARGWFGHRGYELALS
jgi:transposase